MYTNIILLIVSIWLFGDWRTRNRTVDVTRRVLSSLATACFIATLSVLWRESLLSSLVATSALKEIIASV